MHKQELQYKCDMLKYIKQLEMSPISYSWKTNDTPPKVKGHVLAVDKWDERTQTCIDITAYQPKSRKTLEYVVEFLQVRTSPYSANMQTYTGRYAKTIYGLLHNAYRLGIMKGK